MICRQVARFKRGDISLEDENLADHRNVTIPEMVKTVPDVVT